MPQISTPVSSTINYHKLGSGPALVLLHGFPASSDLWRKVTHELCRSFTLILPDFPGCGESVLDKYTSISDLADCVLSIMDTEGIDRAVIAGHSMGGYVGFEFAAKYPGRLAGLSLVHSTPLADDEEKVKIRLKAIELIQKGGKSMFIRQTVPNLFSASSLGKAPEIVEEQVSAGLEIADEAIINFYKAMIARKDHSGLLQNARFPFQWIIGKEDNIIPIQKILPFCYHSPINFVSVYNSCGHMSMLESPERLSIDLNRFATYSYEHKLPESQ